jgi:glycosyltransferase involved in cell wall biosynthesis
MTGVSFVVTVYNKAPFLAGVLDALAGQAGDFEREFIFVDDGSTDGSADILRTRTADWQAVTILTQANAGPSIASNAGFARARLAFVKPVDGDDLLTPEATRLLLDALGRTGTGVAYGRQGDYEPGRGYRDAVGHESPADADTAALETVSDALDLTITSVPFNPSQMLVRTALVHRVGGSDEGVFAQDYSLALRLAAATRFVRCDGVVSLIPRPLGSRLSANKAQMLHDANLALARFLEQHPDLAYRYRRKAFRRAAGRALKWTRRHRGAGLISHELVVYWRSLLGLSRDPAADVRATCRTFRAGGGVTRMPGVPSQCRESAACGQG